jgi:hypothetical protein
MKKQIIKSNGQEITIYEKATRIQTVGDLLDLMADAKSLTIALYKESLNQEFFELKTGLAGEMLQKFSNYQRRLIIIGDFSNVKSKSFNDFMYECNKIGKIIFSDDIEKAIKLLR